MRPRPPSSGALDEVLEMSLVRAERHAPPPELVEELPEAEADIRSRAPCAALAPLIARDGLLHLDLAETTGNRLPKDNRAIDTLLASDAVDSPELLVRQAQGCHGHEEY